MSSQMNGLYGRKLGMTQLFEDNGTVQGVTVVEIGPNVVMQVKTTAGADGYDAIQFGFGSRKAKHATKAELGHARKYGVEGDGAPRLVRELRVDAATVAGVTTGQVLTAKDVFHPGDMVDVQGTSKGRGFTGVMKRHNMRGFSQSHGVHEYFRHGGSIGTRLTPGMTWKGVKMPGHHGNATVSVQNLRIVKVDAERNLVYILGGVPGPDGGTVLVRKAVKRKK